MISQAVIMALVSPFAGRLSDRIEPRLMSSLGMTVTAIALGLFATISQETGIWFILLNLFIFGLGLGLFSSPNTNAIMSSVDKKYYGVASGTMGTMRLTGQMFSLSIAMLILALHMGRVQITSEYYPAFLSSIKTAFILFTALCFGGVFASYARGKVR